MKTWDPELTGPLVVALLVLLGILVVELAGKQS